MIKAKLGKTLATRHGIAPNSISDWMKKQDDIYKEFESGQCSASKKAEKGCKYEKVDNAIFTWFNQARSNNIPISGQILLEKANQYVVSLYDEDQRISPSWINRWKVRHSIASKVVSGEELSVTTAMTSSWLETHLPTLLSRYKLHDIYNADEFGLFYAALPNTSLFFLCILKKKKKYFSSS